MSRERANVSDEIVKRVLDEFGRASRGAKKLFSIWRGGGARSFF
jgi:hypothetical protein